MSAVVDFKPAPALAMTEGELCGVLQSSLYPGAKIESIKLVIGYCKAAGLDPMQKPVHIVPMSVSTGKKDGDGWDIKEMRDVVMPGIGLYRIQAARSGQYAGVSEPEFGPDVTEELDGFSITFPAWCKVTVKRLMLNNAVVEFSATERWKENYATKSSKSVAPNAMWKRRPYAQLAKCAEAQALRKAFPEFGAQPTADEMEGKALDESIERDVTPAVEMPQRKAEQKPARQSVTVDQETGEGRQESSGGQATDAAPTSDPAPESGTVADVSARPMQAGQLRIISAKLKHAALTETDVVAKFGKPLADADGVPTFRFDDFPTITAWISERSGAV